MSKTMATLFLVGSLTLSAGPVLAGNPSAEAPSAQAQKARLESGLHTLAMHGTPGTKLGAAKQAEITRQRSEIKDLIRRLEAGQNVAPAEVDHALQPR